MDLRSGNVNSLSCLFETYFPKQPRQVANFAKVTVAMAAVREIMLARRGQKAKEHPLEAAFGHASSPKKNLTLS